MPRKKTQNTKKEAEKAVAEESSIVASYKVIFDLQKNKDNTVQVRISGIPSEDERLNEYAKVFVQPMIIYIDQFQKKLKETKEAEENKKELDKDA